MNNDVLSEYEKMWDGILEQIRKLMIVRILLKKIIIKLK